MFEKAISRETLQALDLVAAARVLPPKTYLAGGTAAALQLGHRHSYDLDFFTSQRFDATRIIKKFKKVSGFRLDKSSWQTVLGYLDSTQCTLFFYQYPLLCKTHRYRGVAVADLRDIAAMKIAAIADRGVKRDFIDAYFIIREGGVALKEMMRLYGNKYGVLEVNRVHILKSLVYFEDAEKEKMPHMVRPVSWNEVKKFFEREVKKMV